MKWNVRMGSKKSKKLGTTAIGGVESIEKKIVFFLHKYILESIIPKQSVLDCLGFSNIFSAFYSRSFVSWNWLLEKIRYFSGKINTCKTVVIVLFYLKQFSFQIFILPTYYIALFFKKKRTWIYWLYESQVLASWVSSLPKAVLHVLL